MSVSIDTTVQGVRTNAHSGMASEVTVRATIRHAHPDCVELGADDLYLFLHGGPTGWESAPLGRLLADLRDDPTSPGWIACFGTAGRWDALVITRESILSLGDAFAALNRRDWERVVT